MASSRWPKAEIRFCWSVWDAASFAAGWVSPHPVCRYSIRAVDCQSTQRRRTKDTFRTDVCSVELTSQSGVMAAKRRAPWRRTSPDAMADPEDPSTPAPPRSGR